MCPEGADGLCFFAVENKRGFEGDAAIASLAAAIQSTISSLPSLNKRVPSRWIQVFDELKQQDGKPVLGLSECCAIAASCGLPHASHGMTLEAEVELLLRPWTQLVV